MGRLRARHARHPGRPGTARTSVTVPVPALDTRVPSSMSRSRQGTYTSESVEPVVVTLVDVEADLWSVMDADGTVWLLPGYRFIGNDGGWYTVPAVTDEYLIGVG